MSLKNNPGSFEKNAGTMHRPSSTPQGGGSVALYMLEELLQTKIFFKWTAVYQYTNKI